MVVPSYKQHINSITFKAQGVASRRYGRQCEKQRLGGILLSSLGWTVCSTHESTCAMFICIRPAENLAF